MYEKANFQFIITIMLGVCLILVSSSALMAQSGKISGRVTDAETGEPLPGANVMIIEVQTGSSEATELGAAADNDGYYYIVNVPPGTYIVVARMIGYRDVRKKGVDVSINNTTPINFALQPSQIEGESITVIAEREIISFDQSTSQSNLNADEVENIPNVINIRNALGTMVGVDMDPNSANPQMMVRGGGRGQNLLMVDGNTMVDNQSNRAMFNMVNLSAVQEINVEKGGFNAEYGNVRSGVINIVTKSGDPSEYHGSISARYTPAYRKHRGPSIFSMDNYFIKPFVDPKYAYEGTNSMPEEMQNQYPDFQGWNSLAEDREATPEDLRALFMWNHRVKGVDTLDRINPDYPTREPGSYADKPDYNIDAAFGGPVPFISKPLGDLTFFVSHNTNKEMFALPTIRDYYTEQNSQLKLTSRITNNFKVTLQGMKGITNTTTIDPRGAGIDQFLRSGKHFLNNWVCESDDYLLAGSGCMYYPSSLNPYDINTEMVGITIEHVLSKNTWYNLNISQTNRDKEATSKGRPRDTETIGHIGPIPVDESPIGYVKELTTMQDGMSDGGEGATYDNSSASTFNFKFDITSQIDRFNQVKAGIDFTYDDIYLNYGYYLPGDVGNNWMAESSRDPYRFGAYIQNKLEFEGMIANFGIRADYQNPNDQSYITEDPYAKWFTSAFVDQLEEEAPSKQAEQKLNISPRFGISHPISENAKLYFNYGHFYSMPTAVEMFVKQKSATNILQYLGNPNLKMPKTVAYELGVEYGLFDMMMIRLAGYYKDVSNQLAETQYTNYTGTIDYTTWENRNYEDIRGFELRISKNVGDWVTGWVNYDYMVSTSGYVGRNHYYQDPVAQRLYGLTNPYQEKPLATPIGSANISFHSPQDFGPTVLSNIKPLERVRINLRYDWRAGNYLTFRPEGDDTDNLRWKDVHNADLRISKSMMLDNFNFNLYLDITNVFNFKRVQSEGFADDDDWQDYMESLHLPIYNQDRFPDLEGGNDKPGMIKSDDKSYINMPNRYFLTYHRPRYITLGLRINF